MNAGYFFFRDLRYNSEAVKRAYYKEWKDFMDNHCQELLDYVETCGNELTGQKKVYYEKTLKLKK